MKHSIADFKRLALTASVLALRNAHRALFRVLWFDYAIGERNPWSGFVCDEHKISDSVEKLAPPQIAKAEVWIKGRAGIQCLGVPFSIY